MMARWPGAAALIAVVAAGSAAAQTSPPVRPGDRPARNLHRGETLDRPGDRPGDRRSEREGGRTAIIGRDAQALSRMFGEPRLDIHEGAAHKLQFAGDRCTLDAYLYAPRDDAEPVVTHIDARAPDGSDVDADACAALLRRR